MSKETQRTEELLLEEVIYRAAIMRDVSPEAVTKVPELMKHITDLCEYETADISAADIIAELAFLRYQKDLDTAKNSKAEKVKEIREVWIRRLEMEQSQA